MTLDLPQLAPFEVSPTLQGILPASTALAAVALIAYLFGRKTWDGKQVALDAQRQYEIERASNIAQQLEAAAHSLRHDLTFHLSRLTRFKRRLSEAQLCGVDEDTWQSLFVEADQILALTLQLTRNLSSAYEALRQQFDGLESFSKRHTGPLTGVRHGQPLCESIDSLVVLVKRKGGGFSVVLVSPDPNTGEPVESHEITNQSLFSKLTLLIEPCIRDLGFVARYEDESLAIVIPQTRLNAACEIGERVRKLVFERLSMTVCCGIAEYKPGDNAELLLVRARSALYSAKASGPNRQFIHTGDQICVTASGASAQTVDDFESDDGLSKNSEVTNAHSGDEMPQIPSVDAEVARS